MTEFDLIARYFTRPARRAALGVGDDCALINPAPGMQLAISSDMLVEGCHFFSDVSPYSLGHKALAVNLSDLAACGATPAGFTLALALPSIDAVWLQEFSRGLWALADRHSCELIGGDTTQGPLNICITVFGEVPVLNGRSQALLRSGAQPGDDLYVSGTLGDAALALDVLFGRLTVPDAVLDTARLRLEKPSPRVALGQALRGIASAAIDHRYFAKHGDANVERSTGGVTADQLTAMVIGQRQQPLCKGPEPGFIHLRQGQRQRKRQGRGTTGCQIAQIDGQRFVPQSTRVNSRQEVPALNHHVAGDGELGARAWL